MRQRPQLTISCEGAAACFRAAVFKASQRCVSFLAKTKEEADNCSALIWFSPLPSAGRPNSALSLTVVSSPCCVVIKCRLQVVFRVITMQAPVWETVFKYIQPKEKAKCRLGVGLYLEVCLWFTHGWNQCYAACNVCLTKWITPSRLNSPVVLACIFTFLEANLFVVLTPVGAWAV